jgi:hypothetical protein
LPDLKAQMPASLQRRQLDLIQEMNRDLAATPGAPEQVEGVIQSYELAFRMEGKVAELLDISKEPQKVRDASGAVRQRVRPAADRQGPDGRDHNITGYPMWLAGAGVKKGFSYGATDEYGVHAVEGRMHTTDLHATLLALLGLDHEKLTYRYAGRSFRLTDVAGNVVEEIMA